MFLVAANTRQAIVGQKEWITTGSSGIQVQFLFSSDWDGLSKFAVFRNAEIEESVIPIALPASGLTELPAENCDAEYVDEKVYVGVYGTDGLGHIIIPTIWVSLGVLKEGAAYEGMDPPQPTPDMWAQILAIAQNAGAENAAAAEQSAEEAEASKEAIQDMNVQAETLPDESPLTVTKEVDPETGAVTLIFGLTRGPKGTTGDDGYSPTITITPIQGGHRFTVTDKDHPTGQSFDVMNGAPGAPGSPGAPGYSPEVTITTITGGHRVTITDEDHPTGQSFDVMDGAPDAGQVSYDQTQTYQSGTVGKELSDQKNAIDTKIGFSKADKSVLYNATTGEIPSTTFAETRRWFLNRIFAANETVDSIDFKSNRLTQQTVYFEIWEKNGNSLTKVKTVEQIVNEVKVYSVDINYHGLTDYMIAINQTGHAVCYEDRTGLYVLTSTDVTVATSTLDYSSLSSAFENYYPCISVYITSVGHDNVVLIGDGQTYTEIQDALDGITDDTADNPYTFVLLPKTAPYKPFSMLRSFDDPYPWSNIAPRYISIVGIDKAYCVVQSNSGDYKLPCGELLTNGIVKNMTFVMTNEEQTETATQGGYCLHIDCRTLNDVGYNMTIEDCDFENASASCIGIGIHKNCTLTIRRCNLHTTLSADYNPHSGYSSLVNYGVIFCHTSTLATATNQQIIIEDCVGICDEGRRSLWISTAGDYDITSGYFHYTLIRNVFWNNEQDAPAYDISSGLIADPANSCNNSDEYNIKNAISQKQNAPSTAGTAGQVLGLDSNLDPVWMDQTGGGMNIVALLGTQITQVGMNNTMYMCGELTELTFTAPTAGITGIRFTSGTTPTVLTISGATAWMFDFDPTSLEANTTYEINVLNGVGCAGWA